MAEISVNFETCTGCGACAAVCNVTQVYTMQDVKAKVASARRCWECGQCVAVCQVDAIAHSAFSLGDCPIVEPFTVDEFQRMAEILQSRRSVRVFKNKTVDREIIEELVQISSSAPSAKNRQTVGWIAMDDPMKIADLRGRTIAVLCEAALSLRKKAEDPSEKEDKQRQYLLFAKSLEFLQRREDRGEDALFYGAPVLLMAHVPEGEFGVEDAVYAAYSLMLAAHVRGLGSCQIGYLNVALDQHPALHGTLCLPAGRRVAIALILGYPKYQYRRAISRRPHEVVWGD